MENKNDFTTVDATPDLDARCVTIMSLENQSALLLALLNGTLVVRDGVIVKNEPRTSGPRG